MTETNPKANLRLFVAICLPPDILSVLVQCQKQLSKAGVNARWVKPQSIHLTLKFIGPTPAGRIPFIKAAMALSTARTPPFNIELHGVGVFPDLRRARVIWAGIRGQVDMLRALQTHLDSQLVEAGLVSDAKPFRPHLTLGRLIKPPAVPTLTAAIRQTGAIQSSTACTVDAIQLMQSELRRHGAVYTTLFSSQLTGNNSPFENQTGRLP